jgi:hypothetical protein
MAGRRNGPRYEHGDPRKNPSGMPAKGQAPEFEPGNTVAQVHGGGSRGAYWLDKRPTQAIAALAADIAERFLDGYCPPQLLMPQFKPAIESWARREARVVLLSDWLDTLPVEEWAVPQKTGAMKSPYEIYLTAEHSAAKARKDLGLDPSSYASILKDLGIAGRQQEDALERMATQGAEIRRLRAVEGRTEA